MGSQELYTIQMPHTLRSDPTVGGLSSAYNLLSNGAKDMTLYVQESLRLVRSLAREVVHRHHLLNTDSSSCLDTGRVLDLQGNPTNRPRPGSSLKPD